MSIFESTSIIRIEFEKVVVEYQSEGSIDDFDDIFNKFSARIVEKQYIIEPACAINELKEICFNHMLEIGFDENDFETLTQIDFFKETLSDIANSKTGKIVRFVFESANTERGFAATWYEIESEINIIDMEKKRKFSEMTECNSNTRDDEDEDE